MNINIYDLTGKLCFHHGRNIDNNEFELMNSTQELRQLLIYPRRNNNRRPYLQNPVTPNIEDFSENGMAFNYDNSFFLHDILENLDVPDRLRDFFECQKGLLNPYPDADTNIILVPDDYNAEKQEKILRYCALPRNKTFLLWRSVAVCLGAEEWLREMHATENKRIAVIDVHQRGVNISILTLKKDKRKLIPCRKAFAANIENYPIINGQIEGGYYNIPPYTRDFWQHTFQKPGEHIVPSEGGMWFRLNFPELARHYAVPQRAVGNIDYCIIARGNEEINCPGNNIHRETPEENLIARGAGRFAVRQANQQATYFDQCETFALIIQDNQNETIIPKILIQENEFCRGGARIEGKVNEDCFIESGNTCVKFLLSLGNVSPNMPLKELQQDFGQETHKKQLLTLKPSMIPGQGIAQVEVVANPLLRQNVFLDFLQMKSSNETINTLQQKIPRSFPIDIPDVDAEESLWDSNAVSGYLNGDAVDSGIFAKSQWPNIQSPGIERFKRINVFGTNPDRRCPRVDNHILEMLFQTLHHDYQQNGEPARDGIIRLIAWTYQYDNPLFQNIIQDTLVRMRMAAHFRIQPRAQEYTLCANMLSTATQQNEFFSLFCIRAEHALNWTRQNNGEVKGMDHWLRALSGMLMYNNEILKYIPTETCLQGAAYLGKIYVSYINAGKLPRYVKVVIKCLLFLLKRRKYDNRFLRDVNDDIYRIIREGCQLVNENLFYQEVIGPLATALVTYMEGKGNLEGIPVGNDD